MRYKPNLILWKFSPSLSWEASGTQEINSEKRLFLGFLKYWRFPSCSAIVSDKSTLGQKKELYWIESSLSVLNEPLDSILTVGICTKVSRAGIYIYMGGIDWNRGGADNTTATGSPLAELSSH